MEGWYQVQHFIFLSRIWFLPTWPLAKTSKPATVSWVKTKRSEVKSVSRINMNTFWMQQKTPLHAVPSALDTALMPTADFRQYLAGTGCGRFDKEAGICRHPAFREQQWCRNRQHQKARVRKRRNSNCCMVSKYKSMGRTLASLGI